MMLSLHINLRLKVHKLPHQMQVDVLSQNGREMDIVMMGITIQVVIMMVEIAAQMKDLYTAEYVNARILTILQQLFQDAVLTHLGKMMEIVIMKIILKNVIMMEEIAAPTLSRTIAHFVNAKTLNITTI